MDEVLLMGILLGRAARDINIICSIGGMLIVKMLFILQGVVLKSAACGWLLSAPLLIRPPNGSND